MKITFVCDKFTKSSIRVEPWRHIFEISKRIMRNRNSVSVITGGFPRLPREEEIDGIHIQRIRKRMYMYNRPELLQCLNESNADIVNWHSGPLSAIYFCRLHKSIRKDMVWSIYSSKSSWQDLRNIGTKEIFSLDRFWYFFLVLFFPDYILRKGANISQIHRLITKSKHERDHLLKIGIPEKKIVMIPSAVDTDKFKQSKNLDRHDARKNLGFRSDDLVVLYFGSPSRFRGLDTVLEAMPLVLKEVKSTKLLILSRQTPYDKKSKLLNDIPSKHQSIKVINGVISQATLIRFLSGADVVTLPFKFWPMTTCPLTILEAMSMEKPVITCPVGGIPEIIRSGETGILVNPNSPQSVAKALIELWKRKDLARKIGERARKHVLKHHSLDDITQQTMLLFKECATEQYSSILSK